MSELERIGRFPRANCGSTKGVSCWARRRAVSLYFCKGKFQVRGAEPNFCVVVLSCMIFDETMSEFLPEFACLAQASQARLGEICRDSEISLCLSSSLRRGDLVLGDRPSPLGECDSPKRESVIGVKHVAFYGLWPEMISLELWLGIADEHEEPLSCGSGWRVCRCECAGCGQYRWVRMDCPPQ
ncbi:hypothetical protein DEO72_LG7g1844 [Vigna unguiculata]|uniref:Uncharacterized protein n=1 Tax=Vigna unguiculata TaxID=3917 RepID=A0A4D6MIE1_VIGUN|nr:hypothetical protein DEO72_LG7g1844 [Vigna unguiculata]